MTSSLLRPLRSIMSLTGARQIPKSPNLGHRSQRKSLILRAVLKGRNFLFFNFFFLIRLFAPLGPTSVTSKQWILNPQNLLHLFLYITVDNINFIKLYENWEKILIITTFFSYKYSFLFLELFILKMLFKNKIITN